MIEVYKVYVFVLRVNYSNLFKGQKVGDLLAKVKETVEAYGYCVIVVGEGIKNKEGEEIGADKTRLDAFGHPVLAGAAEKLKEFIQEKLNTKTRTVLLGYAQRAAAHCASLTDTENGFACGESAVRAAETAIGLDSELAEGHAALGLLLEDVTGVL